MSGAQAEQAASSIGKAEARAAAATAALQQQAERSAAVQASLHADISALKAQLSTVRSEVCLPALHAGPLVA
jgi:predicted 2-oxoglutarate/Fe(II)-dependent dioxygenase YbiX